MWENRKGLAAGCASNESARASAAAGITERVDALFATLRDIEEAIDQAGAVLAITQPVRLPGRVTLRWWALSGHGKYREPVLVRWLPQKNGVLTPKPLSARSVRMRRRGTSAINAAEAERCLTILRSLMQHRKKVLARIEALRRRCGGMNAAYYLNNQRLGIEEVKRAAVANLLEHGYDVESRYFSEAA